LHTTHTHARSLARTPTPSVHPQFFVVGHDCGHRSFSTNKLVEDIVGTLMFMPLVYPFEPWRIKHNQHHAQTNKCARPPPPVGCPARHRPPRAISPRAPFAPRPARATGCVDSRARLTGRGC
jgi:hypothetical protein